MTTFMLSERPDLEHRTLAPFNLWADALAVRPRGCYR